MQESKPIIILKAGSTFAPIREHYGDFDDWISQGLGGASPVRVMDAQRCSALPAFDEIAGVIISGSHAMVTDQAPWMKALSHWLFRLAHDPSAPPVLGLCFGHQLLAQALGGEVADNPRGMEAGTVPLHLTPAGYQDALLGTMASHPWAQVVHRQSVISPPQGAVLLAGNVHDACQAFRFGERVWGVQFHPEFSADAMRAYLQVLRGRVLSDFQVEDRLQEVRECEDASAILSHFAQLTLARVA
ncbi:MAG: glutamine amidotransferase [Alcanivorax sp.]|nr:glutamine amidotransferase [Alcanivorax sp.]